MPVVTGSYPFENEIYLLWRNDFRLDNRSVRIIVKQEKEARNRRYTGTFRA